MHFLCVSDGQVCHIYETNDGVESNRLEFKLSATEVLEKDLHFCR